MSATAANLIHAFHAERAAKEGAIGAKTGAVTVAPRTSADRLNPHLHAVFLAGAWHEQGGELAFEGPGHPKTGDSEEIQNEAQTIGDCGQSIDR